MDSPVTQTLTEIITIDKKAATPVYIQIVQQIINAIQRGYLHAGTHLPGSRTLSRILRLHRNTVVAVYEELASQGWVDIVPNKGTFVLKPARQNPPILPKGIEQVTSYPVKTGFSFFGSNHLVPITEKSNALFHLDDGQPDLRLSRVNHLSRWYSSAMKRSSVLKKWNGSNHGVSFFENQLCNYLNATRNLHIQPKNLLTTRSHQMSLYIISQLLFRTGDVVLVGNLSNSAANMVFHQSGAEIQTVPTDHDGIDVAYIRKHFSPQSIRCVYCTPRRHYPTTAGLSAQRRIQLLQLAREYGFAVIEDDFDFDYQFDAVPAPPMAGADTEGLIIYLGRFGQPLLPAFQTGFVVAPQNLINEAKNYLQMIDPEGDLIREQVLAEMIHEGEMHRLLKKSVIAYRKRRDLFCAELDRHFGNGIEYVRPNGGLAVFIMFRKQLPLMKLAMQAAKIDLNIPKNLLYQTRDICGIRLGFGHLNEEEIPQVVAKLKQAYDAARELPGF